MKKFLILAIALVMSVCGAWAQDWTDQGTLRISPALTAGGEFSNGTVFYTIKGKANNGYLRSDALSNGHLSARGTATSGNEGRWAVIGSDETGYQVINKATKEAIAMSKDFSHTAKPNDTPYANASSLTLDYTDANTFFDITTHKTTSGYWVLSAHNDNAYFWNDLNTLGYWYSAAGYGWVGWGGDGNGDNGASFQFTMVEELVLNTFTFVLPEGVTVTYGENTYNNNETVDVTGAVAVAEVTVNEEAPAGYEYVVTVDAVNKTVTVTVQQKKVKTLADLNTNKLYTISSQSRGSFVYASSYSATNLSGSKRANYNSGNLDATDANFQFAFVQEEGNYYLWSKGANKWAAYANPNVTLSETLPAAGLTFKASTGSTKDSYPVVIAIDGSHEINMSTDQHQGLLTTWNDTGDAGNMLNIVPVADLSSEDLANIEALLHPTDRADITYDFYIDGVKFDSETINCKKGEAFPEPTKIFTGYTISGKPETLVEAEGTYNLTLSDFAGPFVPTTIDGDNFAAGTKWYYMENGDNKVNGYAVYGSDSKSTFTTTAGTTDNYQWTFVRKTGTPYFYLYNKAAGVVAMREQLSSNTGYASSHNQGYVVANGTDLEMPLQVYQNVDGFALKLAANEGTCLLGMHVDSNLSIWGNSASLDNPGSRFTFTLIDSYTLNVGETGFATLYLDENVTVPEGVEVYLCTSEDGTKIDATTFGEDDVLQGYMGYVVKAEPNTNVEFTYTDNDYEGSLDIIDNVLFGVLRETAVSSLPVFQQNPYVLSVVEGHVGFYKFVGETLKANRAFYVPVGGAADVQGFVLDFGGQTVGIEGLQTVAPVKGAFDLQGRRVKAATRGLFIQNGVKVIK